jgi:hypothetical protein
VWPGNSSTRRGSISGSNLTSHEVEQIEIMIRTLKTPTKVGFRPCVITLASLQAS